MHERSAVNDDKRFKPLGDAGLHRVSQIVTDKHLLPIHNMNYTKANELLTGRCHESRRIGNNTYLQRRPGGEIAVRLHRTDIVTYRPDGSVILDSGGWRTVTTKARINQYMPAECSLYQRDWEWYLERDGSDPIVFEDGMYATR